MASKYTPRAATKAGARAYAHVIRNDDERVRPIVDASLGASAEDWLRTEAV